MTQNFSDEELDELEREREAEVLDDEYWYDNYHNSIREEEAVERNYDKLKENESES